MRAATAAAMSTIFAFATVKIELAFVTTFEMLETSPETGLIAAINAAIVTTAA